MAAPDRLSGTAGLALGVASPERLGTIVAAKLEPAGRVLLSQIGYHFRLLLRTPRTIFSAFLLPVLLLVAVGATGSSTPQRRAELVVGITTFAVIGASYLVHATGLVTARDRGILKRIRGTAIPPWAYFAGRLVATTALALAAAAVSLIAAVLVLGASVSLSSLPGVALGVIAGALCWAALGTAVTRLANDAAAAGAVLPATYLPLVLVSGIFFPISSEPALLQQAVQWLPAEPLTHTIAVSMASAHASFGDLRDVLLLAAWAVAGLVIALRFFRWEQPAQRCGAVGKE